MVRREGAMAEDEAEFLARLGLKPGDRVIHEYEDDGQGGPPRKIGTTIISGSECGPRHAAPPAPCDRNPCR